MAPKPAAPGRTLVVFGLGLVILFGLVALAGQWKPVSGLDLQGGERLTLQATDRPAPGDLAESAEIVADRMAALDAPGRVFTRGDSEVVVEVPDRVGFGLADQLQRRGRLGIRLVACSSSQSGACAQAPEGAPEGDEGASETPEEPAPTDVPGALVWTAQPPAAWVERFTAGSCPMPEAPGDDPAEPLVACDGQGAKYLLTPAVVEGDRVDGAEALQVGGTWQVQLDLDGAGTRTFGEMSQALLPGRRPFAVVLDGRVVTAPAMQGLVNDGRPSFSGGFDQDSASDVAAGLSVGALPLSFDADPVVEALGPPAADRGAALWAALAALLVAAAAAFVRYRRAALIGSAAVLVAGAATWALVALLGQALDLTLGVPVLAALLVGLGLVVDSFVVLVERMRAELREGKSARGAVEDAWKPVRDRRLAGVAAVLATALVLGVVGTGAVRDFAIVLGVVALVDLAVLLFLTHPLLVSTGALPAVPSTPGRSRPPGAPRLWFAVSAALLVVALVGLVLPGLDRGADLAGGTEVTVSAPDGGNDRPSVEAVREGISGLGRDTGPVEVRTLGEGLVARTDRLGAADAESVVQSVGATTGPSEVSVADIGPTWRSDRLGRLLAAGGAVLLLALLLLRSWTGGWKPAIVGVTAVGFDLLVTSGLGALLGLDVSTATVVGLLAVLTFSLHDKVVVLDRIGEASRDLSRSRGSWVDAVSTALADTVGRSAATGVAVLLPVLALLVTGVVQPGRSVVDDLALVLGLGLPVVLWSSLFLAVPLLVRMRAGEKEIALAERRAAARKDKPKPAKAPEKASAGAAPRPAAGRPVSTSGSAKRVQPTRKPKSKRGKR